jgi:hypothetical protein
MPLRISTGLRNHLLSGGSLKQSLQGGRIEIYTGTQPTSPDDAATGTLLVTITDNSGAHTVETPATGSVELTGGGSGNISAITVGGVNILDETVTYATSLNNTASLLAAALNRSSLNNDFKATVVGAIVTLTCHPGLGTKFNTVAVSGTTATITTSFTNFSGGVAAVNGLRFEDGSAGTMAKRTTQTWTGVAGNTGTAGWFRHYGPNTDSGTADADGVKLRMDGAIATSGSQLNMSPTSMTSGATQTISAYSPSLPASA